MKLTGLLIVAASFISGLTAYSQEVKPASVVGICEIEPTPDQGMTNGQFETFYLEEFIPAFNIAFSSVPISLMKGERGERERKYAEFYVFESLKERNRWFPEEGVSSEETKQGFEKMGEAWDKYKTTASSKVYTDYIVLPFSGKSITLKPGNVVSIWEVEYTLEEGMTFDQLEQLYLEEYIPVLKKNFPGVESFLMKGERGERTGKYIEFAVYESLEERNKWFPEQGKSSEEAKKALNKMREIQDRMKKLYSSATYTNYVVL